MKAMVLREAKPIENNPLELTELAEPQPAARQVRIVVETCGLCHTDLHTVEGELALPKLPLVPGHQVVGKIDQTGANVTQWAPGDRVGLAWLGQTCQRCPFCTGGQENLCEQVKFTGYHFDGGYGEYVLADAEYIYAVPANVSSVSAAPLLCAGIIGYRALRLSRIKPGQRLGLYGFGASAHLTIQMARHWGCEVYVFSRSVPHRRHAEQLGAIWTGQVGDPVPKTLHGSILFAPAGELVPPALESLEKGGTLALAGIYMTDIPPLNYDRHLYYEKTLVSVTASTRQDGRELMQLAGEIPLSTTTEEFPLDQANVALQRVKTSRINGAAVLRVRI